MPSTAPMPEPDRLAGLAWLRAAVARQCRYAVALVQEQGVLNTTVTLTGSSQVALARNPRGRANTAVARRAPAEYDQRYDNAGDPVVITPQGRALQQRPDDGYIYPADGSSSDPVYPAPRRTYGAQQVYPQQQRYYYEPRLCAGSARLLPAAPRPISRAAITPTRIDAPYSSPTRGPYARPRQGGIWSNRQSRPADGLRLRSTPICPTQRACRRRPPRGRRPRPWWRRFIRHRARYPRYKPSS